MTKEKLKALFEQHKGEFISGEKIAIELGLTRAAVWKAIKGLREEGYDIESTKKSGYKLNLNSDILSLTKIGQELSVAIPKASIQVHKVVDSTNKMLMIDGIQGAKEWSTIVAEEQISGKAKDGQIYHSPKSKGIYMSILLRPKIEEIQDKNLMEWVIQTLVEILYDVTGVHFEGDLKTGAIYDKDKKVCGVLIEQIKEMYTEQIEQIVVGIGINVYGENTQFGVAQQSNGSLYEVTQQYYNRSELIAKILNVFYTQYTCSKVL